VNNDFEEIREEAFVSCFTVLFQNMLGLMRKTTKTLNGNSRSAAETRTLDLQTSKQEC
jgi:hypothetical protein